MGIKLISFSGNGYYLVFCKVGKEYPHFKINRNYPFVSANIARSIRNNLEILPTTSYSINLNFYGFLFRKYLLSNSSYLEWKFTFLHSYY